MRCEIFGLLILDFTDVSQYIIHEATSALEPEKLSGYSEVPSFSVCRSVCQIWLFAPVCACILLLEPVENNPDAGSRTGDTSGTHACQMCLLGHVKIAGFQSSR